MVSHGRLGLGGAGILTLAAAISAQTALGTLRGVVLDEQVHAHAAIRGREDAVFEAGPERG